MQNYYYKHAFLYIFYFYTFLASFFSCFLHICTAWAISSLIASSISLPADQDRLRAVWGEPKKNELWKHEWRMVVIDTHHECSVVGSHFPAVAGPTSPRFAMTMEDISASGIWVELISHFQLEVLFSIQRAGCRCNDKNWGSHIRPEVSNPGGRCDKKEVGPHLCGETCTNIIWKRIEIVFYLRQCYLGFDYSSWTYNVTLIIEWLILALALSWHESLNETRSNGVYLQVSQVTALPSGSYGLVCVSETQAGTKPHGRTVKTLQENLAGEPKLVLVSGGCLKQETLLCQSSHK